MEEINSAVFRWSPHSPVSSASESGQGTVKSSTTADRNITLGGNYARQKVSAQVTYNDLLESGITATGLSEIVGSTRPKAPPSVTADGGKQSSHLELDRSRPLRGDHHPIRIQLQAVYGLLMDFRHNLQHSARS